MLYPSSLTLGALKESSVKNISGVCTSNPEFLGQVNESVSRLMTYGSFWSTTIKGRICAYPPLGITWPRFVGTLLATNIGSHTRPIANKWFDFMPISSSDCTGAMGLGGTRCWNSNVTVVDDGVACVFQNIPCGTPMFIQAYARVRADLGKTVTVYGIDEFGNEYMTRDNQTGEWSIGEVLTLSAPLVQTTGKLRSLTRISKEQTIGYVDVYSYDEDNNILREMGHYEPSETEPRYRHTSIRNSRGICCNSSDGTRQPQITFLAKLQHIPVQQDSDIVQIENVTAIKLMIQAIRLEEAGDDNAAATKQALAIKELNRQLADKLPLNQIPVLVMPEGTALPRNAGIGMIF